MSIVTPAGSNNWAYMLFQTTVASGLQVLAGVSVVAGGTVIGAATGGISWSAMFWRLN